MSTQSPRLTITLDASWEPELDEVKREMFLYGSKADVIRHLIQLGLVTWREQRSVVKG